MRQGVCTQPTDVAIGWLRARAFERTALHCVQMHRLVEYYDYPVSFRLNGALVDVVHGMKKPGGGMLQWYEGVVGNATRVPPRFGCSPTRWLHSHSSSWQVCQNYGLCDGPVRVKAHVTKADLGNLSEPWLPVAARALCVKSGLARAT